MNKINLYARVIEVSATAPYCYNCPNCMGKGGDDDTLNTMNGTGSSRALFSNFIDDLYGKIDRNIGKAIAHLREFLKPTGNDWHTLANKKIGAWEADLNAAFQGMPFNDTQSKIDALGAEIKAKFSALTKFNAWLDQASSPEEAWHMQLATYLVKLPLRSARNIIQMVYDIIEMVLYTLVHPCNSMLHLAKHIVNLLHCLMQPETWSKIGVGIIGMHLGQIAVFGNPLSHIALGIGAAMLLAGLSCGALRAAILAEANNQVRGAVKENLFSQISELPECFLTSFFMGMIAGGIQKAITPRFKTLEEAKKFADEYVRKNNLPRNYKVRLHANGKIVIDWDYRTIDIKWLRAHYPELFKGQQTGQSHFRIIITNTGRRYAIAGLADCKAHGFFTKIKEAITGNKPSCRPVITRLRGPWL